MELTSVKSKNKKRIGRGLSAGQGKTAGRGTKGQRSRSGFNIPKKFEGGQTPLSMRLPVMPGFKSHKPKAKVITLDMISANYKNGETLSADSLVGKKLARKGERIKILNDGKISVSVKLSDDLKISSSAKQAIESVKISEPKAEKTTETPAPKKPAAPRKKKTEEK